MNWPPKSAIWSSTTLGEMDRYCPATAAHLWSGAVRDRSIFAVGTAAHMICEAVCVATNEKGEALGPFDLEKITLAEVKVAAEHGRRFEGTPEPPLSPDAYAQGRRLALDWFAANPLEPGGIAEGAVTLNRWTQVVKRSDPQAWMRCIIDLRQDETIDREDTGSFRVVKLTDYKTDWPSYGDAVLDNTQRRIQALAGAAVSEPGFGGIVLEVVNLRRQWAWQRTLAFEEIGILDAWREELVDITAGYEARLGRAESAEHAVELMASPGAACNGCPYLAVCKPGREYLERTPENDEVEALVLRLAACQAESWRVRGILMAATDELGEIVVGDTVAGGQWQNETVIERGALAKIWEVWARMPKPKTDEGLRVDQAYRDRLATFFGSIKTGADTFDSALKSLWPLNRGPKEEREIKRQIRDNLTEQLTKTRRKPKWGLSKLDPAGTQDRQDTGK